MLAIRYAKRSLRLTLRPAFAGNPLRYTSLVLYVANGSGHDHTGKTDKFLHDGPNRQSISVDFVCVTHCSSRRHSTPNRIPARNQFVERANEVVHRVRAFRSQNFKHTSIVEAREFLAGHRCEALGLEDPVEVDGEFGDAINIGGVTNRYPHRKPLLDSPTPHTKELSEFCRDS